MTAPFLDTIREAYCPNGRLEKHLTPTRIRIFPYTTSSVSDPVWAELRLFTGILGHCFRHLSRQQLAGCCDPETVISAAQCRVESNSFTHLADIIREVAFDGPRLCFFHPQMLPHLTFAHPAKSLETFGQFVGDVVFGAEPAHLRIKEGEDGGAGNALISLIRDSIGDLQEMPAQVGGGFRQLPVGLDDVIAQDMTFLRRHPDLFRQSLPEVTKFYSFMYQAMCVERLNAFFAPDKPKPFFFGLEWESLSKGREAYRGGWHRLDPKTMTVFSHANCLELLNYVPFPGLEPPFSYEDIGNWALRATPEQETWARRALDGLIGLYRSAIVDISWETHQAELQEKCSGESHELLRRLKLFFEIVHLQFMEKRKAPAGRYANWFRQFAVDNFLKRRGRIGYTLSLRRDQLLLLTRLCIGDQEKLCIRDLWQELERRGVALDSESRREVVALFDALNILEKKSDSGDAQYVRTSF